MSTTGYTKLGPLVTGPDVEIEVTAWLKAWFPTYIAWVEVDAFGPRDPDDDERVAQNLAEVASWETAEDIKKWPESALPAVVVVSRGTVGTPFRDGNGLVKMTWACGILHVAGADTPDNARRLSQRYAAASRQLIYHHPSIDGFAEDATYQNETYDPLGGNDDRSLAAASVIFTLSVPGVVDTHAGIAEPLDDPFGGIPEPTTPTTRELEVEKR